MLTGAGSPTASLALGNVSAFRRCSVRHDYGDDPGCFNCSDKLYDHDAIGVKVVMANATTSGAYTLTAALANATQPGDTWTLDAKVLSTTAVAINGGTASTTAQSHTFVLIIPSTLSSGTTGAAISNQINLVASAS